VGSYPSYSQLRTMSDEGLIAELDRIAERSELGAPCYLAELTRRELARQTAILLRLSWIMALLTFVVTLLAVALVLNS
jgi:hypothetical protein